MTQMSSPSRQRMAKLVERARMSAATIRSRLGARPQVAVVLGSGLGAFADALGERREMDATDAFLPSPAVGGHAGRVVAGRLGDTEVLVLAGRVHLYEGYTPAEVCLGVRAAAALGSSVVLLTNAAGAVNLDYEVGELVAISDHVNLTGTNPLAGVADPQGPSTFLDCSALYSPRLRAVARELRPTMREGVYGVLSGPSYETPAEVRALGALGVDLAGMSTVLEAIAAHHLGVEVAGFSLVTNRAAGIGGPLSHAEVSSVGAASAGEVLEFLTGMCTAL